MDLKTNERVYIDLVKKDMEQLGSIQDATKQYMFIENICKQLVLLDNKDLTGKIENYFKIQDKVKSEVKQLQEQLQELTDKYSKNCTKIYEELMKL